MNEHKDIKTKLNEVLHHEIPLSRDMGIQVVEYDGSCLTLQAPLDKNINHKMTAFGGSLYSIAVLSGWGLLYLLLQEKGLEGHIVIHESQVKYHQPVQGDLIATGCLNKQADLERFTRIYRRSGKARISLRSEIYFGGVLAFEFNGQYVVHQ